MRVLSVLLLPFTILTLIVDLGRRLAFSAGLVNGKSFSLITKTGEAAQAVASKVQSVYKSYMGKDLTVEQLNERSQKEIQAHAKQLVDGYRALNGGTFHTNSSFSSPHALNGERQISRAQTDLINDINAFVARNATTAEDFVQVLAQAKAMVSEQINEAAGDDVFAT